MLTVQGTGLQHAVPADCLQAVATMMGLLEPLETLSYISCLGHGVLPQQPRHNTVTFLEHSNPPQPESEPGLLDLCATSVASLPQKTVLTLLALISMLNKNFSSIVKFRIKRSCDVSHH